LTGFTNYTADGILDHITGEAAIFTKPTAYVALFTAVGTDAGTGFTEVSGGSYARAATAGTDWNAASGTGPSTISNANAISFPTATASWGTVIAWGLYDALTSGNLLAWDYLGNFNWNPITVSSASPGVITEPGHGYTVGDTVIFSVEYGGAAPTFSQSNFTGQLVLAHSATDTFDVTNAATAVNTSSSGSGEIRKITPQAIASGVLPSFGAGALTLSCV
jgi:hypothetical protein